MNNKKKRYLIEGFIVVIILACLLTVMIPKFLFVQKNINSSYHFPDPNFRKVVVETMGRSLSDRITKEDAESYSGTLNCKGKGIKSLKGIEYFSNITGLDCSNNALTELNLSENTDLGYLSCNGNQLTKLDVSKQPWLGKLHCAGNKISAIIFSPQNNIEELVCRNNQFTKLDISQLLDLVVLYCEGNQLKSLDISQLPDLAVLYCDGNQLESMDISKNRGLLHLGISNNQLTSVTPFLDHPSLQKVDISNNLFNKDDIEDIKKLETQLKKRFADQLPM